MQTTYLGKQKKILNIVNFATDGFLLRTGQTFGYCTMVLLLNALSKTLHKCKHFLVHFQSIQIVHHSD
jgi:hypothetical protein